MSLDAISTPKDTTTTTTTTTPQWFADTCDSYEPYISNALRLAEPELYRAMTLDVDVRAAQHEFATHYGDPNFDTASLATCLLNSISIAFHEHVADDFPAIAFGSGPLVGEPFLVGEEPHWVAYPTTIDVLRAGPGSTDGPRDWATLLGAGEGMLCERGKSHLHWLLNVVKRSRPDIATAHGLRLNDDAYCVRLVSLDAAGISSSCSEPADTLDIWIAHVILLYDALAERDTRFTYAGPGSHAARWTFKADPDAEEVSFEPVYSLPTGKMTWAAYETCQRPAGAGAPAHGDEVVGVFKTSWQNARNTSSEGEMLDRAHEGSWLPGLVRHWGHWRTDGPGMTVSYTDHTKEPKETITRHKEILHIASVGQPLSQCGSVREILEVIYDAVCILMELNRRGIIHRDLSWYNLLCRARHNPALLALFPDKKVASVDQVPCIKYVLTGDRDAEPCALVTDLDLSVPFTHDISQAYKGPPEVAGTAMFKSVERGETTRIGRPRNSKTALAALRSQLRRIENDKELFSRAFPGDDDGFVQHIASVFRHQMKGKKPAVPKNCGHHPRHDVESLYWILYYSLARACPLGSDPLDETDGAMSLFVDAMFQASRNPVLRSNYYAAKPIKAVLHPHLERFAPLLEQMVRYLSIPWDHYHNPDATTDIELYHAHIAFKRLLLEEMRVLSEHPELDVVIDTTQPRIRNLEWDDPLPESYHTPLAIEQVTSATASATADGCTTGATSATLLQTDGAASDDSARTSVNTLKRRRSDDEDDAAAPKRPKDACPPRVTVGELAAMFRTDRHLWYGRGDRPVGPKRRSRDAKAFFFVPGSDEIDEYYSGEELDEEEIDDEELDEEEEEEATTCPADRTLSKEA